MDRKNLCIDIVALVVYLAVSNPAITGIGFHEWLGIAIFVVFFAHMVVHFDWILDALQSAFSHPSWTRTGNFVLDGLILLVFVVVTVSGLLISGAVLPHFGLYAQGYYFWDPLHSISAKGLLALLLVHVIVHWKWFARIVRKRKGDRYGTRSER